MKYTELLKLKDSLNSNKYKTSAGNELTIIIAPADKDALEAWKKNMPYIWDDSNPDPYARALTREDDFILYGVRLIKPGFFSGGELNLKKHPELVKRAMPTESRTFR